MLSWGLQAALMLAAGRLGFAHEEEAGEAAGEGEAAPLLSGGVLEPSDVAEAVVQGIREERFLILPHPDVGEYLTRKGADPGRWIAGMRRLVRRAQGDGA